MNNTSIEWTDYSTNPFKVRHKAIDGASCQHCGMPAKNASKLFNFCVRVSDGCRFCYASALTHRWGGPDYGAQMKKCLEPVLVQNELRAILEARVPERSRCFAFDMTDFFFDFWPDEFRDTFLAVAALRPDITFQLLTKRAEQMYGYFADGSNAISPTGFKCPRVNHILNVADQLARKDYPLLFARLFKAVVNRNTYQYLPNCWPGVSVEDQPTANERILWLLKTPAAVRVISYEPALTAVDFRRLPELDWHVDALTGERFYPTGARRPCYPAINLLIYGGESGANARPSDLAWARQSRDQCMDAGVAFFCKQLGSVPMMKEGCVPLAIRHRKGGNMDEWPEDLRIREFPKGVGKDSVIEDD